MNSADLCLSLTRRNAMCVGLKLQAVLIFFFLAVMGDHQVKDSPENLKYNIWCCQSAVILHPQQQSDVQSVRAGLGFRFLGQKLIVLTEKPCQSKCRIIWKNPQAAHTKCWKCNFFSLFFLTKWFVQRHPAVGRDLLCNLWCRLRSIFGL